MDYFRPIPSCDPARPAAALSLAGGWCWFDRIEVLSRTRPARIIPAHEAPREVLQRLCAARAPQAGCAMDRPQIMGILNVTPDSFSDGGRHDLPDRALAHAQAMVRAGASIIDVGGESTRPGADLVPDAVESARTGPVISALRAAKVAVPISIDTRKASVARAALVAGATLVNDVSAFTHDPELLDLVAQLDVPVCLMHAQGTPQTMQHNPCYDDVLLDVYDWLEARVLAAEAGGISRSRIIVDPGIGFGKTEAHNLALLHRLSLFHALGCPLLLGVSRKRFIGRIGGAGNPADRAHGSVAVALAGVAQGAQILRVHDVAETDQALRLWSAVTLEGEGR
ncbi:dihydropteroate synthase [Plastorhodobacter daqingensis]|uniref:Dihydropteroate synthase n=1 Tax=Plastorhodobacter daqingensis TaxID=1387281 RepID=A0ABW2UKY6_9RHOB